MSLLDKLKAAIWRWNCASQEEREAMCAPLEVAMNIGEIRWVCDGCKYYLVIQDAAGKPVKKVPKTCPSCGRPTKKPEEKK